MRGKTGGKLVRGSVNEKIRRAALTRGVASRRWQAPVNLLKQGDLPWINFVTGIKNYDSIAYEYNPCPPYIQPPKTGNAHGV
jgi:hypothetical protein